jgi:hypothetical protein
MIQFITYPLFLYGIYIPEPISQGEMLLLKRYVYDLSSDNPDFALGDMVVFINETPEVDNPRLGRISVHVFRDFSDVFTVGDEYDDFLDKIERHEEDAPLPGVIQHLMG